MKYLNNIIMSVCFALLGMAALTSCEGSDLYKVGFPDWISRIGGGSQGGSGCHLDSFSRSIGCRG